MPQPSTQTAQNQAEVMSKIMDGAAILLETTAEKKKEDCGFRGDKSQNYVSKPLPAYGVRIYHIFI